MNDEKVVAHMIQYITEEEKKILNQKYLSTKTYKKTVVKNILSELERVILNED